MSMYKYYNSLIRDWARERGLLANGKKITQAIKTMEECTELLDAVNKNDEHAIIDAIGDIYVTLLIQCELNNVSMTKCIDAAYNEIKDRKGYLTPEGMFVKNG